MKSLLTLAAVIVLLATATRPANAANPTPLPHAHAHNDYEHPRPLFDALDHGFCSVEADIWLVNGELLIAHDRKNLKPERTLESLYLKPLAERVKANQDRVYPGGPPFYLLIDVKTEAAATYGRLRDVLAQYADLLTSYEDGRREERGVTIILSGNRATEAVAGEKRRFLAIDGRPENLDTNPPADLYPWISGNWTLLFKSEADGTLSPTERDRLRAFVARAHDQGRKVRFWATPEKPALWAELRAANVDFVNTDRLADLQQFFLRARQE
jgi:hypothetical protein